MNNYYLRIKSEPQSLHIINSAIIMKLLFSIKTIKKSKGGSERVISQIVSGLVNKHDITVLTFDKAYGDIAYPINSAVHKVFLGIGDAGKKATLIESIRRIIALREFIRSEHPDMVIAFQHSMFVPMSIALIGLNIPLISSEHIVPHHYRRKPFEYLLMVLAGLLSYRITVLSEKIKMMYPLMLRSRMVAVANPVYIPETTHDDIHKSSDEGVILNIGRLDPQKDQKILIRAFAVLAGKYPGWKLRIIGSGILREQLERLADDTGFNERISFPGTIDDINQEYLRSDIFAMSSRYESFGLGTAEAMAHGLPVVGFADCPGTNELIIHNENGFLVEGRERHVAMAFAIEKLIMSAELRKSMGERGKVMVAQFSLDNILDKWEEIIKTVAKR